MRQVWITRHGPPDVLQVRDSPEPTPAAGEVRVRVDAAGINFADVSARMGTYPDAPPPPCVVGYEVGGTIDAVGPGVDASRVGRPVIALTRFGGYSEAVVVPDVQAMDRPPGLSARDGAAIPVVYLTAYQILIEVARVRAGDRVLIHQAAGGVGLAALDLCAMLGAETIGTASGAKHAFLRERGLSHAIDYRTLDYEPEVRRITGGQGVDVILDPMGGGSWKKGLRLLAPNGKLVCFGMSAMSTGQERSYVGVVRALASVPWLAINPISLMNGNRAVAGVNVGRLWQHTDRLAAWLARILAWWGEGKVRPHVDRVFAFDDAPAAHAYIQERRNVGKVLLAPDPARVG
ncbi:MAG TPA: medium chain dehydrogenase/reductase family protein [Candidatus Binatia bacterium]|nr:medium chain dehydrogenase/reductase family protein [Candidatus Binatia bacterium]